MNGDKGVRAIVSARCGRGVEGAPSHHQSKYADRCRHEKTNKRQYYTRKYIAEGPSGTLARVPPPRRAAIPRMSHTCAHHFDASLNFTDRFYLPVCLYSYTYICIFNLRHFRLDSRTIQRSDFPSSSITFAVLCAQFHA